MQKFAATVILTEFNNDDVFPYIMERLCDEAANVDFEVVIADDGSSNAAIGRNLDVLRSLMGTGLQGRVRYLWHHDVGYTPARPRNTALESARGEVIVMLDGDCVPMPGFVGAHLAHHGDVDRKRICTGHRAFLHPALLAGRELTEQDVTKRLLHHEEWETDVLKTFVSSPDPWQGVAPRNVSFRMPVPTVWFDEGFVGWGGEDDDFFYRLYYSGYKDVVYDSDIVVSQYDDKLDSRDPHFSQDSIDIALTLSNFLYLMHMRQQKVDYFISCAGELTEFELVDGEFRLIPENMLEIRDFAQAHDVFSHKLAAAISFFDKESLGPELAIKYGGRQAFLKKLVDEQEVGC
jgi:glycosyltransferase involved in cell wall biosynthesis